MKHTSTFFRVLGERRMKTAGMLRIPQLLKYLNEVGLEQGIIPPEVAAAHGVLPEDIELPELEVAKEEADPELEAASQKTSPAEVAEEEESTPTTLPANIIEAG